MCYLNRSKYYIVALTKPFYPATSLPSSFSLPCNYRLNIVAHGVAVPLPGTGVSVANLPGPFGYYSSNNHPSILLPFMNHINIRHWIVASWLMIASLVTPYSVTAQGGPQLRLNAEQARRSAHTRIVGDLAKLESEFKNYESQKSARRGPFRPPNRFLQIQQGRYVAVDAVAETNALALKKDLLALGARNAVSFGRVVSCLVPMDRISQLEGLTSMRFARPAYAMTNAGLVTSQGDSAQRSGLARRKFNVDGSNVKVGVLSNSYNQLIGAKGGVMTGDLPGPENPNGYKKPVQVLEDAGEAANDEGRAILEIIHDVAPGAELAFHTALGGQANFANGILALKDSGCNVIVDDAIYFAEPFFQEGIVAQVINQVAKEGVAYFSSAGNRGRESYEKAFQPSGKRYISGQAHDFAPGDQFLRVFVPAGQEVSFILQWSDPFFSISGRGARTDLNMYLLNDSANQVIDASAFPDLGADPIEGILVTNNGPGAFFNLLIEKAAGPDPEIIKIIGYGTFTIAEHRTNSSTLVGHSNAAGSIAVGAVRYNQTPAFGVTEPRIESFSSAGGTVILFDENGNKISGIVRQKPEIVAPNGNNTTFFLPGQDLEGDGFPNFSGTSASASHAAAVAALMLQASKNALQPGQVRQVLQETALDMDDPFTNTFDKGFDAGTGYGLVQADKAVERVMGAPLIESFVLVNADNGQDIYEIQEGDVINLAALPTHNLNIRANTVPAKVGSVVFDVNGKKATEKLAPYALAGDFNTTPAKYRILTPALAVGNYALSAVAYSGSNSEGVGLAVNFRVVESAVTTFVLVDADTGKDLLQIGDQMLINLTLLPTRNLNIRANTVPAKVGSVVFEHNKYQSVSPTVRVIENLPPYALGGDFNDNPLKYRSLADSLVEPGVYSLLATPYSQAGGRGVAGDPLRVLFGLGPEVEDATMAALPTAANGLSGNSTQGVGTKPVSKENTGVAVGPAAVYPNPTTGKFKVRTGGGAVISLYNAQGQRVYLRQTPEAAAQVDISSLPDGLYIMRVEEGDALHTVRVVKK